MKTITEPVGPEIDWYGGSTISEVTNSDSGLRVVLKGAGKSPPYAEVHFPYARAFQVVEEGDMVGLIDADISTDHFVFKVTAGGWKDGAAGRYLIVSGGIESFYEWLILSDIGYLISVIAPSAPHVRVLGSGA